MFSPAPIQKIFSSEENMEDAIFRTLQVSKRHKIDKELAYFMFVSALFKNELLHLL
jgi:hypothetical protein